MSIVVERYTKIKSNIVSLKPIKPVNIIAVSKTFPIEHIMPLIKHGHRHYGENKVQEAEKKWKLLKQKTSNLKLHMIGRSGSLNVISFNSFSNLICAGIIKLQWNGALTFSNTALFIENLEELSTNSCTALV